MLVVTVDDDGQSANGVGDFSIYTLELVDVDNLDPLLSAVDFSFKVECPSDFDCQTAARLPTGTATDAGHRLSGEGLRQLPAIDARPPVGAAAAMERA